MALPTEFYAPWNSVALVAATAKTILELPTGANRSIAIKELFVSCDNKLDRVHVTVMLPVGGVRWGPQNRSGGG